MTRAKITTDTAIELLSTAIAALGEEVATRAPNSSAQANKAIARNGLNLQQAGLDIATLAAACDALARHRRLIG